MGCAGSSAGRHCKVQTQSVSDESMVQNESPIKAQKGVILHESSAELSPLPAGLGEWIQLPTQHEHSGMLCNDIQLVGVRTAKESPSASPCKVEVGGVNYGLRSQSSHFEDDMGLSMRSNSSNMQLFHTQRPQHLKEEEVTWEWWNNQVEKLLVTKDHNSRTRLQDIPNRLLRQYYIDKDHIELDFSMCFMERSAPYVLGRLLASPHLIEVRWITALRLDSNYFTDEGFGNMLNVMSVVNERQCILPLLRHLYLNNMNLDYRSLHGIVCYLFPVRRFRRARDGSQPRPDRTIAGEEFGIPPEVYFPFRGTPRRALFPSLSVLSLCDNPGIGNGGLVELLRCLIAPHFEERVLPVLDLSRCGIDEVGARYIREYIEKLPAVLNDDNTGIAVQRIVLYGNRHSMS